MESQKLMPNDSCVHTAHDQYGVVGGCLAAIQTPQSCTTGCTKNTTITALARMGNKAGKNKVTAEDMEFLMSQVEDKSLGTKSAFYRLNFTDSGHTKARMKVKGVP